MPSTWPYSVDASVVVSSGVDSLNVYSTSKLGEPMVPLTLQNCVCRVRAAVRGGTAAMAKPEDMPEGNILMYRLCKWSHTLNGADPVQQTQGVLLLRYQVSLA